MNLKQLINWNGTINRKHYFIWGLLLFAIKYNLDRLVALYHEKNWIIINYFLATENVSELGNSEDRLFYLQLLLLSIPFVYFGTVLTLKRLRDAGKSPWLVLFFFLPFLNFLLFAALATLTSASTQPQQGSSWLNRIRPKSKVGSAFFALFITLVLALATSLLLVSQFESYGWGVFIGIPFFLGFGTVLIYGRENLSRRRESIGLALLSVSLFSLVIFILAVEGIICLTMAFPILLLLSSLGALLAYGLVDGSPTENTKSIFLPFLVIPIIGFSEISNSPEPHTTSVTTEIIIDAPKQEVWDQLVAFSEIDEPKDFIFSTGIAYPTHAEIEGTGVGAIRQCNFTTGAFIEPITVWDEPNLLEFSVLDQPPPMIENSPYGDLEVPHLDGYFLSHKGQFKLEELENGQTKLLGTTWYSHDIWPGFYWRLWSDFILHRIHFRVLNHIKLEAELTDSLESEPLK